MHQRPPRTAGPGRTVRPPKSFGSKYPNYVKRDVPTPSFEPQGFQGISTPFPPQMGVVNPQFPAPVHLMNQNPNAHLADNGQLLMNLLNVLAQQRHDPRLPNGNFGNLGMNPQMGFSNVGFPQNAVNGLNLANPLNPFQSQLLAPSYAGFGHPQINHALAMSSMNNQMQNFSCGLPPQLLNGSRSGPFGIPSTSNQPQNPPLLNLVQNLLLTGQNNQATGKNMATPHFVPNQEEERKTSIPQLSNNLQPTFTQPSSNIGNNNHGGTRNFKSQRFGNNDGRSEWKKDGNRFGPQKNNFRQNDNRKRKFETFEKSNHKGVGNKFDRRKKHGFDSCTNEPPELKRNILVPSYSEQEIKKWREDRKKNYPSKANLEQKSKLIHSDILECEAKLRREQLKEILSKQAELGVEVAELPKHLIDADTRINRSDRNRRLFNKRGNGSFKNNRDKRGNNREQFVRNKDPAHMEYNKEPTLLQKLLRVDIQREKRQLLQVFRFMTLNSFFKDWPERALRFPEVQVEESNHELSRGKAGVGTSSRNFAHLDENISKPCVNYSDGSDFGLIRSNGMEHGSKVHLVSNQSVEGAGEGEVID